MRRKVSETLYPVTDLGCVAMNPEPYSAEPN
jgi:hypothetical protein